MSRSRTARTGARRARWSPRPALVRAVAAATALALGPAACAGGSGAGEPPAPAGAESGGIPGAVRWVRTSAEARATFLQTYRRATERVERAAEAHGDTTWGVILDADETVLDNSTYQLRLARRGAPYLPETWNAWVREESAGAKPGARRFIDRVKELGGRIAIVTNRDASVCPETRANLIELGIRPDVLLCRAEGEEGKEERFRRVREGGAVPGVPPLEVVAYLGDNIEDFPGMSQDLRAGSMAALAEFGRTYFVFPNPMYGSWEGNPVP